MNFGVLFLTTWRKCWVRFHQMKIQLRETLLLWLYMYALTEVSFIRRLCVQAPSVDFSCYCWLALTSLKTAAKSIFGDTDKQITNQSQHHLGAALSSRGSAEEFVFKKITVWSSEVLALAEVATSHPHAAFCAFTYGMIGAIPNVRRTLLSTIGGCYPFKSDSCTHWS